MNVTIDQDKCIGCGSCEAICPEVFHIDGAKAVLVDGANPDSVSDKVYEAKDACPVQAISVE